MKIALMNKMKGAVLTQHAGPHAVCIINIQTVSWPQVKTIKMRQEQKPDTGRIIHIRSVRQTIYRKLNAASSNPQKLGPTESLGFAEFTYGPYLIPYFRSWLLSSAYRVTCGPQMATYGDMATTSQVWQTVVVTFPTFLSTTSKDEGDQDDAQEKR